MIVYLAKVSHSLTFRSYDDQFKFIGQGLEMSNEAFPNASVHGPKTLLMPSYKAS